DVICTSPPCAIGPSIVTLNHADSSAGSVSARQTRDGEALITIVLSIRLASRIVMRNLLVACYRGESVCATFRLHVGPTQEFERSTFAAKPTDRAATR